MAADARAQGRAPPPAWLDAAFVEQALRSGGHADARVAGIEIRYADAAGDHYCSSLLRVRARLRGGAPPRSLLLKLPPAAGDWAALVAESRYFAKEAVVLSRVLPAVHALLAAAAPGRSPPLAAQCLLHGAQPAPFLVLEDLRPQGFGMLDRRAGLDRAHALLAVRALARLHGASAALWRRRPELFDGLLSIFTDRGCERRAVYYPTCVERTANTIASWTDFPGDYARKVMALKDCIFPKLQEITRRQHRKFNVLVHGDFWTNNLLFSCQNVLQNIRLVDFQLSHVGNLGVDLILFRYTSLQEDVFDNDWNILLDAYCLELEETLHLLGEEAPTKEDINQQIEEARWYTVLASFIWLPMIKLDSGTFDLDNAVADESAAKNLHTSPTLLRWLKKLLPVFEKQGLFEKEW